MKSNQNSPPISEDSPILVFLLWLSVQLKTAAFFVLFCLKDACMGFCPLLDIKLV